MWTYVMWTRRRAQEQGQDSWAAGAGRFPASSSVLAPYLPKLRTAQVGTLWRDAGAIHVNS
jgi:hypothetical protein